MKRLVAGMDEVMPAASEARAQRKAARKVLEDIDDLLKSVGEENCQGEKVGNAHRQPTVVGFGRRVHQSKTRARRDRPTPGGTSSLLTC